MSRSIEVKKKLKEILNEQESIYRYIAIDKDGDICAYVHHSEIDDDIWTVNSNSTEGYINVDEEIDFDGVSWTDTLVCRDETFMDIESIKKELKKILVEKCEYDYLAIDKDGTAYEYNSLPSYEYYTDRDTRWNVSTSYNWSDITYLIPNYILDYVKMGEIDWKNTLVRRHDGRINMNEDIVHTGIGERIHQVHTRLLGESSESVAVLSRLSSKLIENIKSKEDLISTLTKEVDDLKLEKTRVKRALEILINGY